MNGKLNISNDARVSGLAHLFRCFICMEKVQNARLCPRCSKLCCYACIRRWLTEQRPVCPHCTAPLQLNDLVNCRWAGEVTQYLEVLQSTKAEPSDRDKCEIHSEKLSVFCWTCKTCICHQCALWGGTEHENHTFKPLEEVYNHHASKVKEEMEALKRRLRELVSMDQEIEKNVDSVRNAKDERVREIRNAVEMMIARLETQLKSKLLTLMGQKNQLLQQKDLLESLIHEVEQKLSEISKSDLINMSGQFLQMFTKVHRQPMASFVSAPVPAEFTSELVPAYDSSRFVITNFSALQIKAEAVYSTPLNVTGLTWRLKVYPDGNGVVRGNYLSVFLELTSGLPETSKYEYRVEMVHQASRDNGRNIVREFASDFEVGECWGYNRFFRLDFLASEGYLKDDVLILQFQVRPPTFYQKCRDLMWHVAQLESTQRQYIDQNNELKERLAIELSRNQLSQGKSSPAIDRDGEQPHNQDIHRTKLVHASIAMVTGKGSRPEKEDVVDSSSSSSSSEDELESGRLDELSMTGENDIDEESMTLENNIEQGAAWDGSGECAMNLSLHSEDMSPSPSRGPSSTLKGASGGAITAPSGQEEEVMLLQLLDIHDRNTLSDMIGSYSRLPGSKNWSKRDKRDRDYRANKSLSTPESVLQRLSVHMTDLGGSATGDTTPQATSSSGGGGTGAAGKPDSNLAFPLPWKSKHRPVVPSISLQLSSTDDPATEEQTAGNEGTGGQAEQVETGDQDESLTQTALQDSFLDASLESELNMNLAALSISKYCSDSRGSRGSQELPDRLDTSLDDDNPSSDDHSSAVQRETAASSASRKSSSPGGTQKGSSDDESEGRGSFTVQKLDKSPKGKRDPKPH